ncbi:MAG: hypothetical protein ACXAB2_06105, partial [Candidatus Hodarchaeales archaeon]|jgi:hypothetical protein
VNQRKDFIIYDWLVLEKQKKNQQKQTDDIITEKINELGKGYEKHPELDPLIPKNLRKRAFLEYIFSQIIDCKSTYDISSVFDQITETIFLSERNFYRFIGHKEENAISEEIIQNYLTQLQDKLQMVVNRVNKQSGINSCTKFRYYWSKEVVLDYYERIQKYLGQVEVSKGSHKEKFLRISEKQPKEDSKKINVGKEDPFAYEENKKQRKMNSQEMDRVKEIKTIDRSDRQNEILEKKRVIEIKKDKQLPSQKQRIHVSERLKIEEIGSSRYDKETHIGSRAVLKRLLTTLSKIEDKFGLNNPSPTYEPPKNLILKYNNSNKNKLIIHAESTDDKDLAHFLLEGFGLSNRSKIGKGAFWFGKIIYPMRENRKNEWHRFTSFLSSSCERKIKNHDKWYSSKYAGGEKTVKRRIIVKIDLCALKSLKTELMENAYILANDNTHRKWLNQARADARRNKNPEAALKRLDENISWWNKFRNKNHQIQEDSRAFRTFQHNR